jgi:hypothetical protein
MILERLLKILSNKSTQLYQEIFGSEWGSNITTPSAFIDESWQKLIKSKKSNNYTNGAIFEYLIALCLFSRKILPFYMQANITFVPNALYDIVLYTIQGNPITLSLKASLRERYKQADLEAWALKNVHRGALNYLITLNEKEATRASEKIVKGHLAGLDEVILASSDI